MVAAKALMSEHSMPDFEPGTEYFSIFSLSQDYDLDLRALKASYLQLQQAVHPDRFANDGESEQRHAVQQSAYLNQAYEALKSPLKRAIYMLECKGVEFNADSQTNSDTEFLFSQLQLRERLDQVGRTEDPYAELEDLEVVAKQDYANYQQEFKSQYLASDWSSAATSIHKMMFASKLLDEIRLKEELLDT